MNLNQVTVPVLDIPKAIDFYQTLGLELIVKSPHYARFQCPDGDATFSIHKVETLPGGDGIYVYFECKNLEEKVAKLVALGVKIDELPNDKSWRWREARLKDLDRNQIILFLAGEDRKNPLWRIKDE